MIAERTFNTGSYRFGFNGKEKDDEVKGAGNSLDFGARIYDGRLGRWLALDPHSASYSNLSPFNYAGNNPIFSIDPSGERLIPYFDRNSIDAKGLAKLSATTKGAIEIKNLINAQGINSTFYLKPIFWTFNNEYDSKTNVISYAPTVLFFGNDASAFGHEISHANDDQMQRDLSSKAGAELSQIEAVKFENYLRSVYGESLRTTSGVLKFSDREHLYNPTIEKVENVTLLRNSANENSWELKKGSYIETSFQRSTNNGESQTFYQRISMGTEGDINFSEYNSESELEESRPKEPNKKP